ncbi:CBS domain-containing protein [Corallococcus sp. AB050B]|nr:CBS domain-containing protein [Corallococcus sp. AB050B]
MHRLPSRRTLHQAGSQAAGALVLYRTTSRAFRTRAWRPARQLYSPGTRYAPRGGPTMRISELMHTDVKTIDVDECLRSATERLEASSVGALTVTEHGRVVGLLTDSELSLCSTVHGHDPDVTTVREAMVAPLVTCPEDAPLEAGERLMEEHHVNRLVVVDSEQHAVGLLRLDDVASEPLTLLTPGEPLEHLSLYS